MGYIFLYWTQIVQSVMKNMVFDISANDLIGERSQNDLYSWFFAKCIYILLQILCLSDEIPVWL